MKAISDNSLTIAMLSLHSDPLGKLGTRDTGGMSIYIRELARELARAGHRVDIYTQSSGVGNAETIHLKDNVRVIYLNIPGSRHIPRNRLYLHLPELWSAVEMYRLRNAISYDLVHSHYWVSGQIGTIAQKRWDIPHLLTLHTTGMVKKTNCFQEKESTERLISEKRLANQCDLILAPTEREKDYITRYLQVSEEKVRLVPCGVNFNRFYPVHKEKARDALGLPADKSLLLYVGRFAPVKGIDRLMYAMGHLRKDKNTSLVMVGGDGKESAGFRTIQQLAQRMDILDKVILQGRADHDELPLFYSAADLLVLPSYYESFGLVALESLACGTPVVASNVGAMDEIIHDGLSGAVVNDPGPYAYAQAIRKVITESSENNNSRHIIRQSVYNYGWNSSALKLMNVYADAVSLGSENRRQVLVS